MQSQNLNPNQNIQIIFVEPREPHVGVVKRGGVATGADQNTHQGNPHVRSASQKKSLLDVYKEK